MCVCVDLYKFNYQKYILVLSTKFGVYKISPAALCLFNVVAKLQKVLMFQDHVFSVYEKIPYSAVSDTITYIFHFTTVLGVFCFVQVLFEFFPQNIKFIGCACPRQTTNLQ